MAEVQGWGRSTVSAARVLRPTTPENLADAVTAAGGRGVLARGLGRSYGDAACNAGGRLIDLGAAPSEIHVDDTAGTVTASAGVSIDALLQVLVPRGWFVPVTPGTRQVTLGGALAADVHGKNHHRDGSFAEHVERFGLLTADGRHLDISPRTNPDLFWATAGGMGLTGIVTDLTLGLLAIPSPWLVTESRRVPDLDGLLDAVVTAEANHPYAVSWIDLTGRRAGRGVVDAGSFAPADRGPTGPSPGPDLRLRAPGTVPGGLLNRASIRAFNEAWYRSAPRRPTERLMHYTRFFHPLDGVADWNRLYGPRGFLQWQMVLPDGAESTLVEVIDRLRAHGAPSFLAVLKRFGRANPGHLSFPLSGWTLALDLPAAASGLGPLLDRLDELVAGAGGRVYLAKDARLRGELVPVMYPRLDEWRGVRDSIDPDHRFQSDLARRLGL